MCENPDSQWICFPGQIVEIEDWYGVRTITQEQLVDIAWKTALTNGITTSGTHLGVHGSIEDDNDGLLMTIWFWQNTAWGHRMLSYSHLQLYALGDAEQLWCVFMRCTNVNRCDDYKEWCIV